MSIAAPAENFDNPLDSGSGGGTSVSPSAVSGLTVGRGAVAGTAVVQCDINSIAGWETAAVYRSFTGNFAVAISVQALTRTVGHKSFTDADPTIAGRAVYYWIVLSSSASGDTVFGAVTLSLVAPVAPPAPSFDASHDAVVNGAIKINCVVSAATLDKKSTRIYVNGYRGVAKDIPVHDDSDDSFSFQLLATGEAVTLKAAIVASDGTIGAKTNKAMVLNAVATVPAKPLIESTLLYLNGVQIRIRAGKESGLVTHNLWRAARGGGFGAAAKIANVPSTTEGIIIMDDPAGDAVSYEWYVTAVNAIGESAPSSAIFDTSPY